MKLTLFLSFLTVTIVPGALLSQPATNKNTTLLGTLNPRPGAYSNIWGYAKGGHEYALIGAYEGLSIIEVTNPSSPKEVAFIAGPPSIWRELRVRGDYAYVVTEGSSPANLQGVHIIDLSGLPDTAILVNRFTTGLKGGTVHTISMENQFLYLNGARHPSLPNYVNMILDVTNPVNPVEVGRFEDNYWHDSQALRDTIYAAAIYGQGIQIFDATDKANLKLISQTNYPENFTHNIWPTTDGKFIAQTDEEPNMPLNFWDVTDHSNPKLAAEYIAGQNAMAHNAHINGTLNHVAYYEDGYRLFDIRNRRAPVEVANFDTDGQAGRSGSFTNVWGVFPYLPSGNVLLSDIEDGLFVISVTPADPGYVTGTITDQFGSPVAGVQIHSSLTDPTENRMNVFSLEDGSFYYGSLAEKVDLEFSAEGYETLVLSGIDLVPGATQIRQVEMRKLFQATTSITLKDKNAIPAVNAVTVVSNLTGKYELFTGDQGSTGLQLPEGIWTILAYYPGYIHLADQVEVNSFEPIEKNYTLTPGISWTFSEPVGFSNGEWSVKDQTDKSAFSWKLDNTRNFSSAGSLPGGDHTGDYDSKAFISKARRPSSPAGARGVSTLTSPTIDASALTAPAIRYSRLYRPPVSIGAVNDTFHVDISGDNGSSWVRVNTLTGPDENWVTDVIDLTAHFSTFSQIKIRFQNIEGVDQITSPSVRPITYAAVDDIQIADGSTWLSEMETTGVPGTDLQLLSIWPNPFNPSTTVSWNQRVASPVTLEVFSLTGQRVLVNQSESYGPGIHSTSLRLDGFASGLYLVRLQAVGQTVSRRIVLLK